jgi:pimeloyl-ACP methyl ester carboxylesterase
MTLAETHSGGVMIHIVRLVDGRQATYEVVGRGDTALWLQGSPAPEDACSGECLLVAKLFRSYLVDAPGVGGSSPAPLGEEADLESVAWFYDAARRALGLGEVSVLGSGTGAHQALAYAALFPRAARRCIALDPPPVADDDVLTRLLPHVTKPALLVATGRDGDGSSVAGRLPKAELRSVNDPALLADAVSGWLASVRPREASAAS